MHSHFSELPRFLDEGDLVVINTSGTLAAEVDGTAPDGSPVQVHLSTQLPAGLWTIEVRRNGQADLGASRRGRDRAARRGPRRPPGAVLPGPGGVGVRLWVSHGRDARAAAQLPGPPRPSHPLRLRARELADHRLPERLRHRARVGRDAERRPALHPRGPHPPGGQGRRGRTGPPAHRRGLARGERAALRRVLQGLAVDRAPRQRHPASGGRVIAIGTTVVRTLESVVDEHGHVHPSEGWTETVVSPERPVRSIDGFLTGWHEPEASHLAMLEAIAERDGARSYVSAASPRRWGFMVNQTTRPPKPVSTPWYASSPARARAEGSG